MKKLVNGQLINLTSQEQTLRENEIIQANVLQEQEAPYIELKTLDLELPRWAEDVAEQTHVLLQGRAEEVRQLKVQKRLIIQEREL
jgi:hypothetical protein